GAPGARCRFSRPELRTPGAFLRTSAGDGSGILRRTTASYKFLQSRQRIVWTERLKPLSARPDTFARKLHLEHSNKYVRPMRWSHFALGSTVAQARLFHCSLASPC